MYSDYVWMTIICLYCKFSGVKNLKRSKVLVSTIINSQAQHKGKFLKTATMRRRRECPNCGWRWNTIEIELKGRIEMVYFAWVQGLRGPEAQIWHGTPTDGNGKAKKSLFCIALADDDTRTLDELKLAYPVEVKEV